MEYVVVFLEGIITFISPCLLPMLPVYVSYFAAGEENGQKTLQNALAFILGFTAVFVAFGALAGTLGGLLVRYRRAVDLFCGLVVVFFGLQYLGVIRWNLFRGVSASQGKPLGFCSAVLFGVVFSLGWTPCVGAFLGSALALAAQSGTVMSGILMLLAYSLGLGIPFLISALLIERLKGLFFGIKRHYRVINAVCGGFLILIGVLMATGLFGTWLGLIGRYAG